MKHISKMIAVTMIVMICIFGLTTTAFAEETQSETGLQASIVTDKESYAAKEQIKVDFKVRNTNGYDINNVVMNASIPSDYTVKDGASTSKTLSTLHSSSEDGFSLVLVANDQGGNTSNGAENKSGTSPKTGDARNIAIIVIALAASGTVIFLNRKRLIKGISVSLCIAICLTTAAVVGVPSASAAEIDKITVSKTFTVDNVEHTITLIVSSDKHVSGGVNLTGYKMSDASGYIDDNLYADVEDLSHVEVDSDTLISYFDNEVSFMVKDGVTERDVVDKIINKYDAVIVGKSTVTGRYLIRFNNDTYTYNDIAKIQEDLSKNPLVDAAYANYAVEIEEDAFYPQGDLWSSEYDDSDDGVNWGIEAIKAPQAWDYYDLMNDAEVGVFETKGFYSDHPDLRNKIRRVENTQGTLEDHGTHVTGIIAAEFNNQLGINGVSPTAYISYIDGLTADNENFQDRENLTSSFYECNAYDFLIHNCNCKVVNFSQGIGEIGYIYHASGNGNSDQVSEAREIISTYSEQVKDTLTILLKNHEFVICSAAGNDRNRLLYKVDESQLKYKVFADSAWLPGMIDTKDNMDSQYNSLINYINDSELRDRIIVVGNAERDLFGFSLEDHSNTGDRVDVMAPGTLIQSTVTNNPKNVLNIKKVTENNVVNKYALDTGTSMSAPHAAGIAAILYALNPNLTGKEVKKIICETATTNVYGTDKKMVNAEAAVKKLLENDYYAEPCKFSYNSQIVDVDTNQPISDVKVTVTSHLLSGDVLHTQTVKSNNNGYVNFKEFAGNCDLTFEKDGYETVKVINKYDKGVMYTNIDPVGMRNLNPTKKEYTAAELVNKSLYEVIDTLGNDYTLDNHGYMVYESYGFTLVTDFQRNISTPNELADPLPESEKQRFNEALKNKTLILKSITVFGKGKLDGNINAGMSYNDLTSYYGDFDCHIGNRVDIPNTGHSQVYVYTVYNDSGNTIATYGFDMDQNRNPSNGVEMAEDMKAINPKIWQISVYPGYNGYFKPESTEWANAYANYLQNVDNYGKDMKFTIGYVDDDNIPELFIVKGNAHALGVECYTYNSGEVVLLKLVGSYGAAAYTPKKGIIHGGHVGMGANSGTFDKLENGKLSVLMSYTYFDENFNGTNKGKYYLDSSGGNKVTADKEVTKDQYFNTINPYINNYNYVAVGWDSIIPYVVDSTIDELRTNPYRWMNPNEVNGNYLAYDDVIYEVKGN